MKRKKLKKKIKAEIEWAKNQKKLTAKKDELDWIRFFGMDYRISALYDLAYELGFNPDTWNA